MRIGKHEIDWFRPSSFVNGEWRDGGDSFSVMDPSSGEKISDISSLDSKGVQLAIKTAHAAHREWKEKTADARSAVLHNFAHEIRSHGRILAEVLTLEQGKPLAEAEKEVAYGAAFMEWYAEEARRVYGRLIPASSPDKRILVRHEPVGVVAGITPWNFPSAMIARKAAPALAAGCSYIGKPAPETPLSACALAGLSVRAGVPPGVFNIITGDAVLVAAEFMQSPLVRKITFTGSTEVGKLLYRQSADTVKKITLELGGNAPFIVFEDANLEDAIKGALFAKYRNGGQTCICVNRFIVHKSIVDAFAEKLITASKALKCGPGMEPSTDIGPLINEDAISKVERLIGNALANGAQCLLGGTRCTNSLLFPPTIIKGVTPQMDIWREEIFGPVCSITTFTSDEEALELANDTRYGLASYLYTQNLHRAFRISEALHFGMVGVNDTTISTPQAPFGGVKESGIGREGGLEGIHEYLTPKYISLGIQ